jgi:hypothetical protein
MSMQRRASLKSVVPKATSRALTEAGRPMTNGIIMNGNNTTSRMGTIGNVTVSGLSFDLLNMPDYCT